VVNEGKVVGEGYHERPGSAHAEVIALKRAGSMARGGTLYVNLEPCCHFGKTPPCVGEIIKAGVKQVICSMEDPNPLVSGRGFAGLKEAGIPVKVGILEDEARRLNEAFIKFITTGIPFITAKYAMSLDGKIATRSGLSRWITGEDSRELVHRLRQRTDGIIVGIGTVIKDDPLLTCRLPESRKQPVRIVVDSTLRIPENARLITNRDSLTIIATTSRSEARAKELESIGVQILEVPEKSGRVDVTALVAALGKKGLTRLLVEGGSALMASFFEEKLVDKVYVFTAPLIIGGGDAPTPVGGIGSLNLEDAPRIKDMEVSRVGDDVFVTGYVAYGRGEGHVHRPC